MIVAILDDGICQEEIESKVERYCVGNSVKKNSAFDDKNSHATVCAKIIEKYSSPEKIYDIVFLGNDDLATPEDIIAALEFCLGLDIDVISGLVITAYGNTYDCSFKNEGVEHMEIDGVNLPLDSLDAWYEIYSLQGRVEKARYIKDYQLYHKK